VESLKEIKKLGKNIKIFALTLLTSLLLISILSAIMSVEAQGDATVIVLDAIGGTVDLSGTNTYADGTVVTFKATPANQYFAFVNWIVVTDTETYTISGNPGQITVAGGVTYAIQAYFQPVQQAPGTPPITDMTNAAIVVVLASGGGTTTPAPGTYVMANAAQLNLTATPNSGWKFSHWVISGDSTSHGGAPVNLLPTDNPYNVNHGYGYTYKYQAVFIPVESTQPPPTDGNGNGGGTSGGMSNETWIIIGLVVVIVVLLIALVVFASKRKK
jgi:hypothetical protein